MIDPTDLLLIDRSDRERLRLAGADRAKFLHNYCTNDIKKLSPGSGCEAFVTSPQGKTIGFFSVIADADSLLLRTDPDGFALVLPHFAKYAVFDDVSWQDERETTFEIHLTGDEIASTLGRLGISPPARDLDHVSAQVGDVPVRVIRESPCGVPGFTFVGPIAGRVSFTDAIAAAVSPRVPRVLSPEEADGLRIASGTPAFGRDVQAENLPQEIGRDATAISFVKGCYLGQETVARLDALGHVNRLLHRLEVTGGDAPAIGGTIVASDAPAGLVTSVGRSPRDGKVVALAMVRVKQAGAGTRVSWDQDGNRGEGVILPLTPG